MVFLDKDTTMENAQKHYICTHVLIIYSYNSHFIIVHPSTTWTSCMISPYKVYACTSPLRQAYYVNYPSKYPQFDQHKKIRQI
jgi:hypothetical protein